MGQSSTTKKSPPRDAASKVAQQRLPETPTATVEEVSNALEKLPARLKVRVEFNPDTREIGVRNALSRDDKKLLQVALAKVEGADRVVERLFLKSNRIQASELNHRFHKLVSAAHFDTSYSRPSNRLQAPETT